MSIGKRVSIKHYRGDTYDADIVIENYIPASSDEIVFCIRKSCDDTTALVRKEISPADLHIHLTSAETQTLPTEAVYDLQITYVDTDGVSYTETPLYGSFRCMKDVAR